MITKTEGVCGGRACIEGTRMPVWVIASMLRGLPDMEIFQTYPWMTPTQLNAAKDYMFYHRKEIQQDIADNTHFSHASCPVCRYKLGAFTLCDECLERRSLHSSAERGNRPPMTPTIPANKLPHQPTGELPASITTTMYGVQYRNGDGGPWVFIPGPQNFDDEMSVYAQVSAYEQGYGSAYRFRPVKISNTITVEAL